MGIITYTQFSADTHIIISGTTVTIIDNTITFSELKKVNGDPVPNQVYTFTGDFSKTFTGAILDDDPTEKKNPSIIEGCFILGEGNKIYGAIRRTHKTFGAGDEPDVGVFSGTHNQ